MANTQSTDQKQAPSEGEAVFQPLYASAEEAWDDLLVQCGIAEKDRLMFRSIFMAGMSAALSIAYHHGFEAVREELDRILRAMPR